MRRTFAILLLFLIGFGLLDLTPAVVTTDEIRGTLQSLIYSYNQLDNKLERHEHRERALGDSMKKAMQSLQKGLKNLEPINGIFARLDERVNQIETMLIMQEDKYKIQTDKLGEALEHIYKWMRENDECYKRPPVHPGSMPPALTAAPTQEITEKANKELLVEIKKLSINVELLLKSSDQMQQQTEVIYNSVPSTSEMLTKIEHLAAPPPAEMMQSPITEQFKTTVLQKFLELSSGIAELTVIQKTQKIDLGLTKEDKDFIHGLNNETLNALQTVKSDTMNANTEIINRSSAQLQQVEQAINNNIKQVSTGVENSSMVLDKFYKDMNGSYSKLNEALEIFDKFNNILMTNSEYVLETQRKLEFGTLQTVQKIENMLQNSQKELATLISERFDNVDKTATLNRVEIVKNLTASINSEINNVWHQMEFIHGIISDSNSLLKLMQGRTETYVNTTFTGMTSMGGKVEDVKGRMLDMDANLNFLLGRLSIMSQEFKDIKVGLAESLDELRNTFQSLQREIPLKGPGPHNIAKNEYETELNLLQKRHVTQ